MAYTHTRAYTIEVPFEYTCERCGRPSGVQTAAFRLGASSGLKGLQLSQQADQKLTENAQANAARFLAQYRRDVEEKQKYSDFFPNTCPHCGKNQRWGKGNMLRTGLMIVLGCTALAAILSQLGGFYLSGLILAVLLCLLVSPVIVFPLLWARQTLFPPKPKYPPTVYWPPNG